MRLKLGIVLNHYDVLEAAHVRNRLRLDVDLDARRATAFVVMMQSIN